MRGSDPSCTTIGLLPFKLHAVTRSGIWGMSVKEMRVKAQMRSQITVKSTFNDTRDTGIAPEVYH